MSYRPPVLTATNTASVNTNVDGSIPTTQTTTERDAMISEMRGETAQVETNARDMQQADRERALPRARTDNLNRDAGRHLTPVGETIEPPSPYSHRMNRRNANAAINHLRNARGYRRSYEAIQKMITPTQEQAVTRAALNEALETTSFDDLPTETKKTVRDIDRAIQQAERLNDRNHVVYTKLAVDGTSKEAFLRGLSEYRRYKQTLLGYTRANHDINKIDDDEDGIYMQIETSRGMYVGGEGNTGHLLPRGIELEYVGQGEFTIDDGNGGTVRRTVAQFREIPQDERTTPRR